MSYISRVPRPSLALPAFNVARKKNWESEREPGDEARATLYLSLFAVYASGMWSVHVHVHVCCTVPIERSIKLLVDFIFDWGIHVYI